MKKARRLLLLEFVAAGPHRDQLASFFPFYAGFAERNAVKTLWLCTADRSGADLARRIADFAPTFVLISVSVTPELRALLSECAPGCALLTTVEEFPPSRSEWTSSLSLVVGQAGLAAEPEEALLAEQASIMARLIKTGWLAAWLGLPVEENRYFVGGVSPRYDAVLTPEARALKPFLTVLGGVSCDYRADLRRNPYFKDVDLAGCLQRAGCSFCTSDVLPTSPMNLDPVELARAQFSAIARAAGGRSCGRFEVRDIRLFRGISDFIAMLDGAGLEPSEFHFAPRIDQLLNVGSDLERLLPKLAARGHRLILFRMGLEHFVAAENERFNKGLTRDQIDRGLDLAERLRAAHPEHFDYARPLGYIAFTPWTTLEDIELSISEGIKRGLAPQAPWLYAVLELDSRTAITALARQEGGILRKKYDDVAMTYHMTVDDRLSPELLPWRFRDRRTAEACAIIVRLCALSLRGEKSDSVFADDALYGWLKKLVDEEKLSVRRPDLFAASLVSLMKSTPRPGGRKALIRAAFASMTRPQPAP